MAAPLMHATTRFRRVGLLIVIALLTGCGVRIEMATPVRTPVSAPPSAQENGVTRILARPRLAFTDNGEGFAQLFGVDRVPDTPLIIGKQASLEIPYAATWFTSAQGTGRIRLSVLTRSRPEQPWQKYDGAEVELSSTGAPFALEDTLTLGIPTTTRGQLFVRAEIELLARLAGGVLVTRSATLEFAVIALSDPGEIVNDPAMIKPALGTLNGNAPLFDWRAWHGGPCQLAKESTVKAVTELLTDACRLLNVRDLPGCLSALGKAADVTPVGDFKATLFEQAGLILVSQGDFVNARGVLQLAAGHWLESDQTVRALTAVLNVANATRMLPDADSQAGAAETLERVLELQWQVDDPVGRGLTLANLGHLTKNEALLRMAVDLYAEGGLPQLPIMQAWLDQVGGATRTGN